MAPPAPVGRALVTGVTGFIGAHLARSLLADGAAVHALVRPGARLDRIPDLAPRLRIHTDDGSSIGMARVVEDANPDVTFHLATRFLTQHLPDDISGLVVDNVTFPTRLADALAAESRSFVNVGTMWQHVEGAAYRPKNLYAATKQAFDDILRFYTGRALLQVATVELYDSYGPEDHRSKLLSVLRDALRRGKPVDMSSGRQLIDLVHVDDVVRALRLAAGHCGTGPPSARFGVSSGRPLQVREVVDLVGQIAGAPVPVRWGVRPELADEMLRPWDVSPPVPGWTPEVELDDGLRAFLGDSPSAS